MGGRLHDNLPAYPNKPFPEQSLGYPPGINTFLNGKKLVDPHGTGIPGNDNLSRLHLRFLKNW
jgi:hypothetical protein